MITNKKYKHGFEIIKNFQSMNDGFLDIIMNSLFISMTFKNDVLNFWNYRSS